MTHLIPSEAPRRLGGKRLLAQDLGGAGQGIHPAQARPRVVRHDHHDPADPADAVRLRHQHQSAPSADRGAAAGAQRSRPLDPGRAEATPTISSVTQLPRNEAELDRSAGVGQGAVRHRNPGRFRAQRAARRQAGACWSRPTPPIRSPPARRSARSARWCRPRWCTTATFPTPPRLPFEIRTHARYNPAGVTQLNIVPGLVGTILTMTMLIFTALSVTREIERGTMENLLSMPITPVEIMLGKIIPYVIVGFVQAALIIGIGVLLFGVPILGSLGAAGRALRRCSSPPICRSATPSRPWRRTSCRRCRCRSCSSCRTFCCPASCFRSPACRSGRNGSARRCRSRITCASCARSCSRAPRSPICITTPPRMFVLMLVAMTIAVTRFRRTLD